MKSSIKMFGIALGSIAIVGGGVSTAAYFLIDKQEPTDNAYKFEGQYFKTDKQVRDYIIKNSEATKVPTFNDQAYWDETAGEFTLKGAWDAAFKGFQVIQDGYEASSTPQVSSNRDFFEISDETKLLSNSQDIHFKTAYIVSAMGNEEGTPSYGRHSHGHPFYIYSSKQEAYVAWMAINDIKTLGKDENGNLDPSRNVYTTDTDFEVAFANRTPSSALFLDESIGEVRIAENLYDAVFDETGFPEMTTTYPDGTFIESTQKLDSHNNPMFDINGNPIMRNLSKNDEIRRINITQNGQDKRPDGKPYTFEPSWQYTETMRDYTLETTMDEEFGTTKKYNKVFFIADTDGNIIDETRATMWGNLPSARDTNFEISNPDFYQFNEVTNLPEGTLSTFEDLVQMKAVKESGFDFIQKDQTVIHYDDVNKLVKDLITNGAIEII